MSPLTRILNFIALTSSVASQQLLGNHFAQRGLNATYDYVVVGGGNAGLAIAYRLAEDGSRTVAVVEAGGFAEIDGGNTTQVPNYCNDYGRTAVGTGNDYPLTDWGFVTTPQQGVNGRSLHYGRGKMLGGSSGENAMIYNRGTTGSYAEWARLVNDSSWTFEQWLPYFVKGIHYNNVSVTSNIRFPNSTDIPLPADAAAYNSTGGGPVQTSYPYSLPFSAWVQGSFRELEFPDQQDFISGHLLGSQYASVTVDPSTRMRSYSRSYLDLALASPRTNLQIYSHTLAKKVLFANGTRATGVRVVSGSGAPYDLTAKSEVILSAGAFQSPQLLMVSGVGPRETLEKYNISVIADRPGVGQGMQDHLDFGPTYQINVQGLTAAYSENNANAIASYIANRTGIFTSPGVEYIGWEKVPTSLSTNFSTETLNDLSKVPSDWPDLEYECAQTNLGVGSDPLGIYATVLAILVAPTSRGNVTIISNDTSDLPIINPNWLTTATDEAVAIAGFKRARQLFNTAAIQPIIIGNEVSPGSNVQSDEQILNWIRETAYQNWHASCTCRMGIVTDPMAVVDSKARVIGVSRLRVVDASAFALLPPGHPQSTVYGFAEKIAGDIIGN